MEDFASDCSSIGCPLKYSKDAKALKHKSGWYLVVEPQYIEAFKNVFKQQETVLEEIPINKGEEPVIELIKEAGFEYIDKRDKKGSLWIIAGKDEAEEFVKKCEVKGITWAFAPNGSRTTKRKPGWYCK